MRRTTTTVAIATAVAVGLAAPTGPADAAGASAPSAPSDVTVAWQAASTAGWLDSDAPPEHEVLVSWSGASDVVYRVCPDGGPSYLCVTSTPEHPTSAVLGVDDIPESPATRIAVTATAAGQPDSAAALSPVFDSLRADAPSVLEVRPSDGGSLLLSWAHRAVTADTNPGDPLDVDPPTEPVFRVGRVDADWTVWGPTTTAVSTTLDAPRGGLFAVTEVNEWNIRRTRSIDPPVVNVWMTDVYPVVPRSTTYRAMTTVRGEVDANAYWCYGMPPQCSSDDGPGYSYATRPQAGRLVALQARRSSTAGWVTVATTYSDIHGRFVLRTRSTGTRQLRTLALPTSAPDKPRASDASPAVTVVSRQTVRSASVSRHHAATGSWITARAGFLATCSSVAVLQRSTAAGWRTVARARMHRGSGSASASVGVTVRHGLSRYRWLVHSCTSPQHLPVASATSSTLRVRGS